MLSSTISLPSWIPVVSLHCVVKLVSDHFHTGGAKPKPVFLPTTTAAMAAHWEVHFIGAGHFSEKGNKNILHLMLNCVAHMYLRVGVLLELSSTINFNNTQIQTGLQLPLALSLAYG